MYHKTVAAALNSPLSRKRPAEVPGLEQNKKKIGGIENAGTQRDKKGNHFNAME